MWERTKEFLGMPVDKVLLTSGAILVLLPFDPICHQSSQRDSRSAASPNWALLLTGCEILLPFAWKMQRHHLGGLITERIDHGHMLQFDSDNSISVEALDGLESPYGCAGA